MVEPSHPAAPADANRRSGSRAEPPVPTREPDACAALVALAAREAVPGIDPRRFVRRLGHAGAGIRPGPIGILDLVRAGENRLAGRGFRAALDDGTDGQARHFCGIAACCERFGARPTRWVSVHLRRDPPTSPDGRLTDLAIELVGLLRRGELAIADAPDWLQTSLCARDGTLLAQRDRGQTTP